jgi:hypothetical protein
MTKLAELRAATPARTSIFHPGHPLHHLVLDLVEQVDRTLDQWMAMVTPKSIVEDHLSPDASPKAAQPRWCQLD